MKKEHDLAKWLSGELTGTELEAFEASPEFGSYQKIKTYTDAMQTPEFDADQMYQNIIGHQKKKPVLPLRWLTPVAAILILALGLFFLAKPYFGTTEFAVAGTTKSFVLPDDSQIVLHSGSDIRYKKWNWDNNRQLQLSGEAYFRVAKGKTFAVHTALGTVTVVGTQFNVKARKNLFEVECYEGRVQVSFNQQSLFLMQGQSVTFEDGKATRHDIPDRQPAWMQDQIKFYNQPLETVLAELELHYQIKIDGKAIRLDQHYTGRLPLHNLDTALQIISKTYRFNYTKTSNKKIILTPNVETP